MKRRCSWCNTDMEPNDMEPRDETTHGVCKTCHDAEIAGMYVMPEFSEFRGKTLDQVYKLPGGKLYMKMHMFSSVPDGSAPTTDAIRTFLKGCNRCETL